MKTIIYFFFASGFFLLLVHPSRAQVVKDTTLYRIESADGNNYTGRIISQDSTVIKFLEQSIGEISLQKSDIRKIEKIEISRIVDGVFWSENPHSSRYYWAPNAYSLKAGEGYYQNAYILFNQFIFGVTDFLSLGGGIVPLFLFAGSETPVWVTTKVSFPVIDNMLNLGGGALVGTIAGVRDADYGILYGLTTIGSRDYNLNLGLGYGYAGDQWAKRPVINVSAMLRTGEKGYIMSENYIFSSESEDETFYLFSFGARQPIKKVALDYGLILPMSSGFEDIIAMPFIGLYIPFAKRSETRVK